MTKAFNFANSSVKSNADYAAQVTKTTSKSKVFAPGLHEVTISEVKDMGVSSDATWTKIGLVLNGPGEKQIRSMVLVPHNDVTFKGTSGKPTLVPFKTLKNFVDALGTELTVENVGQVLPMLFNNSEILVGLNLKIKVGYKGSHITYGGKDSTGTTQYNITLGNGTLMADAGAKTLTFANRDAASAYLTENSIDYAEFPSVLSYDKSETPNSLSADANW